MKVVAVAIVVASVILAATVVYVMTNKPKWDCRGDGGFWNEDIETCFK